MGPDAFVYLHAWSEIRTDQLVAFDESGEVRALYPTDPDRFFAGPGLAIGTSLESRVDFTRDSQGRVASLTWRRNDGMPRVARRVTIDRQEDVRFASGNVELAGTSISPATGNRHPAVILVHGSGPAPRDQVLPFARFLTRHGMTVLAYDKRGVGASTGDWNTASFEDLAGDVVAAFEYLKSRSDIDSTQIGWVGARRAGSCRSLRDEPGISHFSSACPALRSPSPRRRLIKRGTK